MKVLNVNGFTILHERIPSSKILNIRCVVNAGSSSEKREEFGVAHYLEHMFFKGTLKKNYKEVNRIVSEIGDTNAYTSRERTVFYISTLTSNFKKAADILTEMVFEPAFPPEEFEKERTVILEEYQSSIDNPNRYFAGISGESFWGTPRGHKVLGNKNTLLNMKLDDLKSFRERFYVIDNLFFVVVGNVSEEEVSNIFGELLANVPSIYYGKKDKSIIDYGDVDCSEFSFNHKSQQSIISIMSKTYGASEDYDTNFVQKVFATGMGSGMHSLLFDRIREELGLCYSIGMSPETYADVGSIYTCCMLDQKNIPLAKEEIFNIYKKVREEGFDLKLLEISKKNLLFGIAGEMEKGEDFAYLFMDNYFRNGCKVYNFEDMQSKIESITNDDIIRFANEYLGEDKCKFISMTQG